MKQNINEIIQIFEFRFDMFAPKEPTVNMIIRGNYKECHSICEDRNQKEMQSMSRPTKAVAVHKPIEVYVMCFGSKYSCAAV